jgi:hypothetical protein
MTLRVGYDATHSNVFAIPHDAAVVLGYDTGTSDVRWTWGDWNRHPQAAHVHIDQGGPGSPVPTATVRDVETGAWTPEAAVGETRNWNAGRRTIYCNQDTLPRVLAAGWRGDLWLAILTDTPPSSPPVVPGCTVVAQQYRFGTYYDTSIVFDPYWPERKPSMPGIQFPAPASLHETATVYVTWAAVPPVGGKPPADYTVLALGMDGHEYFRRVTPDTFAVITNLIRGWTYEVRVWANGGDIAPSHASMMVHT